MDGGTAPVGSPIFSWVIEAPHDGGSVWVAGCRRFHARGVNWRVHICLHMNNEKTCNYISAAPWDAPFTRV